MSQDCEYKELFKSHDSLGDLLSAK